MSDDENYIYEMELYPKALAREVSLLETSAKASEPLEKIYKTGQQALLKLPRAFNGELFKRETVLINTTKAMAFWPELKKNADKVNLLVKFCIKHANNLEQSELDTEELNAPELKIEPMPPKLVENTSKALPAINNKANQTPKASISMRVLGRFIAVMGIAAVALSFAVLNAATLGIAGITVATLGVASFLLGVGLFAFAKKPKPETPSESSQIATSTP